MPGLLHDGFEPCGTQVYFACLAFYHDGVMDGCHKHPGTFQAFFVGVDEAFICDVARRALDRGVDPFAFNFFRSSKEETLSSSSSRTYASILRTFSSSLEALLKLRVSLEILSVRCFEVGHGDMDLGVCCRDPFIDATDSAAIRPPKYDTLGKIALFFPVTICLLCTEHHLSVLGVYVLSLGKHPLKYIVVELIGHDPKLKVREVCPNKGIPWRRDEDLHGFLR